MPRTSSQREGQVTLRLGGFPSDGAVSGSQPLYRCVADNGDRRVTSDPARDDATNEGLLGCAGPWADAFRSVLLRHRPLVRVEAQALQVER